MQIFDFKTGTLRVVEIDGQPWFVAPDLYKLLDLPRSSQSYHMANLAAEEKAYQIMVTPSGPQNCRVVSESGLYKLIMKSRKAEARVFQDWVTKEVLPAIRKDGGYIMGEEKVRTGEMSEDELVLKALKVQQAKIERLRAENAAMAQEKKRVGDNTPHLRPAFALATKGAQAASKANTMPRGPRGQSAINTPHQ